MFPITWWREGGGLQFLPISKTDNPPPSLHLTTHYGCHCDHEVGSNLLHDYLPPKSFIQTAFAAFEFGYFKVSRLLIWNNCLCPLMTIYFYYFKTNYTRYYPIY